MKNKLQIILGLGHTGLSCLRYLKTQGYTDFIVCDTRDNPPNLSVLQKEFPEVVFHAGSFATEILSKAERIIISPGLSLHDAAIQAAMAQGIPLVGDIELFAQAVGNTVPIIAITGTNAKGTVTTMTAAMAEQAGLIVEVGGNIGTPALDLLSKPTPDLYVLELSSFQLETTHTLHARAATILNMTPDHLDHHRDMEEYAVAKQRIYAHAENIVYNRVDEATLPVVASVAKQSTFALDSPPTDNDFGTQTKEGVLWLMQGNTFLLPTSELKVPGSHNVENALAALALAQAIKLPIESCLKALREYQGLPHRCQFVREYKGVRWYNDSKATNVGSTMAALKGFQTDTHRHLILIAGGDAKGADLKIASGLIKSEVHTVLVYGKDAALIQAAWKGLTKIVSVENLKAAVEKGSSMAEKGDLVLLSPACSSLDMFKNFEERGEIFQKLVSELE
jgi:UDP-N-acetylmuramoylalanine--D-glutamate ligase